MNKYKINTTRTFEKELQSIYYYISNQLQEPNIAKQNYRKIKEKILTLQYLPERHQKIFESKFKNLRKLLINNFIIIYEVENKTYQVFILHIFLKNQNYLNQL